ncbi:MAG: hypothetical protein ACRCS3_13435 [Paracoccaceae bacterium]
MATLYTLFGDCYPGISPDKLSLTMAEATGGRRQRLDWFANTTMTWRCLVREGRLVTRIAPALRVSPTMACLIRLEKSADSDQAHDCRARFFDLFAPTAAMICSDGTVLALRHDKQVWISDTAVQVQQQGGWSQFALARYGEQAAFLDQSVIQSKFPKGPAHADPR